MKQVKAIMVSVLRWGVVAAAIGAGPWLLLEMLLQPPGPDDIPHNVPYESWYGNWQAVSIGTAVFALFLLGFAPPRRRRPGNFQGVQALIQLEIVELTAEQALSRE